MDKSTPRPIATPVFHEAAGMVFGCDHVLVGVVEDEYRDELIRAVNRIDAFDALVEALRPFADLGVGSGPGELSETYKIERNAIRAARAALALAKET